MKDNNKPTPSVDVKPRELYLERSKFDSFFKVVDDIQQRADSIYAAFSMEYVGTRNVDKFILVREVLPEQESEITALKAENEKLKSALEFYADETSWCGSRKQIAGRDCFDGNKPHRGGE